ncbi:MAG: Mut7-C RNAse domain-containing protein, partial [Methanothrix sp.]
MVKDRYLADLMLIRLARWLRMAGQDVSNPPEGSDDSDLMEIALKEGKILLTRDR